MRLALRAHRITAIATVQALLAVLGTLFGSRTILLPALAGEVPVALPVALMAVLVIAAPVTRAWPSPRTNPSRNAGAVTAAVLMIAVGSATTAALLTGGVTGIADAVAYLGILAWLLALQTLAAVWITARSSAMTPAVYVFVCCLLGRVDGAVQPWAWPLAGIHPGSALVGGATLAVAVMSLVSIGLHDARTRRVLGRT